MKKKESERSFTLQLLSIVLATVGVLSGIVIHYISNRTQVLLKKYEISFELKNKNVLDFMDMITKTFYDAKHKNISDLNEDLESLENHFFNFGAFLEKGNRDLIFKHIKEYEDYCKNVALRPVLSSEELSQIIDRYLEHRTRFSEEFSLAFK